MTPEELAATFEQTATWLASRPAGVTSTGDGLDGTVAGLRDAAKSIRKQLGPVWKALTRERDELRALIDAGQPTLASQLLAARAALEKLATPVDVTAREEGWLHEHGEDCEAETCEDVELHYRIVLARAALDGQP